LCTAVREAVAADRKWLVEYELCAEGTATGKQFLYIKSYERCFAGSELIKEELGLSPVLDTGVREAIEIYTQLCQAEEPVSALHLHDIVRDLLLAQVSVLEPARRREAERSRPCAASGLCRSAGA